MNIRLNPHSEQLLKEELSRGEFHSEEEVIERALETLSERTQRRATMDAADFPPLPVQMHRPLPR